MEQHGGWMADLHRGGSGLPMHDSVRVTAIAPSDSTTAENMARVCRVRPHADERLADKADGAFQAILSAAKPAVRIIRQTGTTCKRGILP